MPEKMNASKGMVEVFVQGNDMKDNTPIPVTINGYRRLVPVNRRVQVPYEVAEVLKHREEMYNKMAEYDAENAK